MKKNSPQIESIKIPLSIRELTTFFICIPIYALEYQLNTKIDIFKWLIMIVLRNKIPFDKYSTCSKVFCSKAKFTIVYYGNL